MDTKNENMKDQQRLGQLKNLVMLAAADGKVTDSELAVLVAVASREDITPDEISRERLKISRQDSRSLHLEINGIARGEAIVHTPSSTIDNWTFSADLLNKCVNIHRVIVLSEGPKRQHHQEQSGQ